MEIWEKEDDIIRQQIQAGKKKLPTVKVDDAMLEKVTQLCSHLGTDGLRGELTLLRATRAYAALSGKNHVTIEHLKKIAVPALQHRLRRNPLDDSSSAVRVRRALEELFPETTK
jgi:magnesium chelatase subunit I